MTLFASVYHLTGSMRSPAISKLPQSTKVWGKKKKTLEYEKITKLKL